MQTLRQLGPSVLFAAISLLLTLGVLSTALAEKRINQTIPETAISIPLSSPTDAPAQTLPAPGLLPSATLIFSPTPELLPSATMISSPTLNAILPSPTSTGTIIPAGAILTLPPCGAPTGWIAYTVKDGDNLFRIGLAYRISVAQLQNANCLGFSTQIITGQNLYVPNVQTSTPAITITSSPTSTQTPTLTSTATTIPPTATNTATPTLALPTETPTPNPATATSSPTLPDTSQTS